MTRLSRAAWKMVWAGLLAACSEAAPSNAPAAQAVAAEEAPSVETRWVKPEPAARVTWREAAAHVLQSPDASYVVSVPMTARVLRVRVKPGQSVKRDEPMVDVLLPQLLSAAGSLSAANLRIEAYSARRAKLAPLVEQGLSRAIELSEVEANLALAKSEREAARATLRVAGVHESDVPKLLSGDGSIVLRAPRDGMVVSVSTRAGEVREPGSGPLLELVGSGALQVEARFMVQPPAGVAFEGLFNGRAFPLLLDAFSPRAAPEDGSRTAWLHAQDAQAELVAGSLGRVRWLAEPGWLVLPASALRQEAGQSQVFVREGDAPRAKPVQVIASSASDALVTGLSESDWVAADARRVLEGASR